MNEIIVDTLKSLGVPIAFQKYSGNESTYITFFVYNEKGELWADDNEVQTGYYIQVDIWSKNDYAKLVNDVTNAMNNKGFMRSYAIDLYEKDTNIYHKSIRFNYVKGEM